MSTREAAPRGSAWKLDRGARISTVLPGSFQGRDSQPRRLRMGFFPEGTQPVDATNLKG